MPRHLSSVILATLIASSCSPSRFLWQQAPPVVATYRQSYAASAGQRLEATVTRERLLDEIESSPVVWLGDHHRHSRLHGLHHELLGQLQRRGVKLALGLEAIGTADQPAVDDYLAGRTSMRTLRRRLRNRWPGSWLDDRELDPWYFRALLTFAREHDVPVFALEPTPRLPLAARDRYMVTSITAAAERWPERVLAVVVGQSHLLGQGDLVGRSQLGGVVFGASPTEPLRGPAPRATERGTCWRSDAGVYWFGEMFASGRS